MPVSFGFLKQKKIVHIHMLAKDAKSRMQRKESLIGKKEKINSKIKRWKLAPHDES